MRSKKETVHFTWGKSEEDGCVVFVSCEDSFGDGASGSITAKRADEFCAWWQEQKKEVKG